MGAVRALRNAAIIALLAFIVVAVPGGGEAGRALITALTICFLALIGFAAYDAYRRHRLSFLSLSDQSRTILLVALGAIVLMLVGFDELTDTGAGLLLWLALLGVAVFGLIRVWSEATRSY